MAITLYKRQRQIYDYIGQYIQKNGFSPTLKEMAEAIGVSSLATIHEHLQSLEKKGVIRKTDGQTRSIELLDRTFVTTGDSIDLPILGWLIIGKPIEPYAEKNASFKVSPELISGKRRAYCLRIKDDSLTNDLIYQGDYLVIEETPEAENGQVIVALLENGLAILKKYFKEMTRIRLEPVEDETGPIYASQVQIQGRVVGLIRKYN
ncbi:MAG TPA: transcriptional repressor LexA [Candidatus Woesebacteria bacterium]|nr:transcriptional repressor LexA [Candidatus Woesebacteria bacterium]